MSLATGWSLGGYLSIAIARKLAARAGSTLSVAGMLLIDSPYHPPTDQIPPSDAEPLLDDLPVLVKKSFEEAERMLETWELPRWDGPACGGRPTRFSTAGEEHTVLERTALHKGLDGQWRTLPASGWKPMTGDGLGKKIPASPPPAVMTRCVRRTPIATPDEDGPLQVDMYRDDPFLGWSSGEYPNFVQAAIDTDSGHYDVFKFSRVSPVFYSRLLARADLSIPPQIEQTTREINECLEILDNLRPG